MYFLGPIVFTVISFVLNTIRLFVQPYKEFIVSNDTVYLIFPTPLCKVSQEYRDENILAEFYIQKREIRLDYAV